MNQKFTAKLAAVAAAAALVCTLAQPAALSASAAPAYESRWTQTISMEELLLPALSNPWTDANGTYRQLKQALRFKTLYQGNILSLWQKGARIPAESLRMLSEEGLISGYLYKLIAGLPFAASDFRDVFNANYYYAANPDLAAAGIPLDENQLFQHFLTQGMAQGRVAAPSFNLSYFKANYPQLEKAMGCSNVNWYLYYILYGKDNGQVADRLLKK